MTLPDRTLCWVEGPPWDRYCIPVDAAITPDNLQYEANAVLSLMRANPELLAIVVRALDDGMKIEWDDEPRLSTPTERALYRDCKRYKAERDALAVATHALLASA